MREFYVVGLTSPPFRNLHLVGYGTASTVFFTTCVTNLTFPPVPNNAPRRIWPAQRTLVSSAVLPLRRPSNPISIDDIPNSRWHR